MSAAVLILFVVIILGSVAPSASAVHVLNSGWEWTASEPPVSGAFITDVAVVTASDVWAVGYVTDPSDESVILHYAGDEWTRVKSPAGVRLYSIAVVSADSIWAGGGGGTILHYGGGGAEWEQVGASGFGGATQEIAMLPTGEGWAIGYEAGGPRYLHCEDKKTWHLETLPTTNSLYGLCALAPDDIWTSWGGGTSAVHFLHWDGSVWSDTAQFSNMSHINKIYAKNKSDVWAIETGTGIFHYDGSSWTSVADTDMNNRDFVLLQDGGLFLIGSSGSSYNRLWYFDGSSQGGALEGPPTDYLMAIAEVEHGQLWTCGSTLCSGAPSGPVLDSVLPNSGTALKELTLQGHRFGGFRGTSSASFNGAPVAGSDYVRWSDNRIMIKVPAGTESGELSVETETGKTQSLQFSFTPTVDSVTPSSAPAGTTVESLKVSGGNFSSDYTILSQEDSSFENGTIGDWERWSDFSSSTEQAYTGTHSGKMTLTAPERGMPKAALDIDFLGLSTAEAAT